MFEDDNTAEPQTFAEARQQYMQAVRRHILELREQNIHNQITHRFSDLLPQRKTQGVSICIVGAGSIGGHTAKILAKLGFTDITVWDDDIVEPHNVGTQPYGLTDLNLLKVDALKDSILQDCGFEIKTKPRKCDYLTDDYYDYVIYATDSIESRSNLYYNSYQPNVALIDARMSLGTWNCIILPSGTDGNTRKQYTTDHLFPKEEALQEPCTARSTTDTPLTVAAYIASAIRYMINNPTTTAGLADLKDPIYRFKWLRSFNALTWDTITQSPEYLRLQQRYAKLVENSVSFPTTTAPAWQYPFTVGNTVVLRGGLHLQVHKIDPDTDTFISGTQTYNATDVRGWL